MHGRADQAIIWVRLNQNNKTHGDDKRRSVPYPHTPRMFHYRDFGESSLSVDLNRNLQYL